MFNVLIVDDDPMVAELNQLFISRVADFHCCGVAATIADAKAMLSHLAQVDLLLLDVYMHRRVARTCCRRFALRGGILTSS